jgi:cystathionine beta-lyase
MRYNFNAPLDRSGNFAAKYDELEKKFGRADVLPLWVADMDIPAALPIVEAIAERNEQAIFGYTSRPDSYNQAICRWQEQRNGWKIDPGLMSFSPGVVPSLCTIVEEFSNPGDTVMFCTPVYPEFFCAVEDWGRVPLTSQLREVNGRYTIDFADFEEKLRQKPALLIWCSPHNPVGRVWTREEQRRVGELCLQYGVLVVSDEIHADLILWGNRHIPFASLDRSFAQNTITCISATKTFNLAGLQASTVVFPNRELKQKFDRFWMRLDIHRNNCFSLVAVEAAFTHGAEWLEQLLRHIESNMRYVQEYLRRRIPEITVELPESTYLLWLDCRKLGMQDPELRHFMVDKARLGLNNVAAFGAGGDGFMRMNVACPESMLQEAMERLQSAVESLRAT